MRNGECAEAPCRRLFLIQAHLPGHLPEQPDTPLVKRDCHMYGSPLRCWKVWRCNTNSQLLKGFRIARKAQVTNKSTAQCICNSCWSRVCWLHRAHKETVSGRADLTKRLSVQPFTLKKGELWSWQLKNTLERIVCELGGRLEEILWQPTRLYWLQRHFLSLQAPAHF